MGLRITPGVGNPAPISTTGKALSVGASSSHRTSRRPAGRWASSTDCGPTRTPGNMSAPQRGQRGNALESVTRPVSRSYAARIASTNGRPDQVSREHGTVHWKEP
jgi:hypothetical protein